MQSANPWQDVLAPFGAERVGPGCAFADGQEEYPEIDAGSGGTAVFGCPPQDFGEISFGFGAKPRMPPPSRRVLNYRRGSPTIAVSPTSAK